MCKSEKKTKALESIETNAWLSKILKNVSNSSFLITNLIKEVKLKSISWGKKNTGRAS
jgi:hypothetical protein